MSTLIYKIYRSQEWQELQSSDTYKGSRDDERDGFIHFSTLEQIAGTLKKHFSTEAQLYIASYKVDTFSKTDLKWEKSRGGAMFPHLYAPLKPESHISCWHLFKGDKPSFDLTPLTEETS